MQSWCFFMCLCVIFTSVFLSNVYEHWRKKLTKTTQKELIKFLSFSRILILASSSLNRVFSYPQWQLSPSQCFLKTCLSTNLLVFRGENRQAFSFFFFHTCRLGDEEKRAKVQQTSRRKWDFNICSLCFPESLFIFFLFPSSDRAW